MITEEKIRAVAEEKLAGTDNFIVEIKVKPVNNITVLLDSEQGITLSRCAEIHRLLEQALDRTEEDFSLEVSSPGLSNPFKVMRQYKKNIGKKVDVITKDGRKLSGTLLSADEQKIEVEETINKKETKVQAIIFNTIKETKSTLPFSKH